MTVQIVYATTQYIPSYHRCLDSVARERIYLAMTEAPPLDRVMGFQSELIARNGPGYYAVDKDQVIGWCDIFPEDGPGQSHRGSLGMGVAATHRGLGIGSKLLASVLGHAARGGLEKVELQVYANNAPAIALYEKHGFEREGLIRKYRKMDGAYFDSVSMAKFL